MATVFVVKTGLCVASGIVAASTFAAGGPLVPARRFALARRAAGELVKIDFGRIGGTQAGGEGNEQHPVVFFIDVFVCVRENALSSS